jgi:hypothetical protein
MKPNIRTLEKLEQINQKIDELYAKKREVLAQLLEKYGPVEVTYELDKPTDDGHRFVRYRFIDNLDSFKSGAPMYKATAFERFGFECRYLKNEPKEK